MRTNRITNFDDVQIIEGKEKSAKTRKSHKRLLIFAVVIVFLASLIGGYFLFNANRIKSTSYHVLVLQTAQTTLKANEMSADIAAAGGSGYIINDGEFKIAAAAYASINDANQVRERLVGTYANAQIISYNLKAKRVDKRLKEPILYVDLLIKYLLEESLNLDLLQITEGALILQNNLKKNEVLDKRGLVDEYLKTNPSSDIAQKTQQLYGLIEENWHYVSSLEGELGAYNHRIKYFSCLLIENYAVLRGQI